MTFAFELPAPPSVPIAGVGPIAPGDLLPDGIDGLTPVEFMIGEKQ